MYFEPDELPALIEALIDLRDGLDPQPAPADEFLAAARAGAVMNALIPTQPVRPVKLTVSIALDYDAADFSPDVLAAIEALAVDLAAIQERLNAEPPS